MRQRLLCLASAIFVIVDLWAPSASATSGTAPNVIITTLFGMDQADIVEIYNQTSAAISLQGWHFTAVSRDTAANGCGDRSASVALPNAWLLAKQYLTLYRTELPAMNADLSGCTLPMLTSMSVHGPDGTGGQTLPIPPGNWSPNIDVEAQHRQRNDTPQTKRVISGDFNADYIMVSANDFHNDPLYTPPTSDKGLQISELLPAPKTCASSDTDPVCHDYIKLYNGGTQSVDLSRYRVRSGTPGNSQTITNTFTWNTALDPSKDELDLAPGAYFLLNHRNDGQPLVISNSGSSIWLEDAYGVTTYDNVITYPSATSHVGQSWMYSGGSWKWSASPQPGGPNVFTAASTSSTSSNTSGGSSAPTASSSSNSSLKPCASDQYRNPDTNRCKLIESTSSTLVPCADDQERNPDTNRCRSIATSASSSTQLQPCQTGWERNPDTHRCRKITAVAGDSTTTAAIKESAAALKTTSYTSWIIAGLVALAALAYAALEWRQEALILLQRTLARVRSR